MARSKDPRAGAQNAPDQSAASAWYRAAAPARPAQAPARPPVSPGPDREAVRRRQRRTKTTALTICIGLFCAALVTAALNSNLARRFRELDTSVPSLYDSGFGYDFDGGEFGFDDGGLLPGDEYEDYRAYFEDYYTGSNEIDLPAAPTGTGVKLRLQAQRGDELTLQQIYEKVSPSVVGITAFLDGEEYAWGTGVVFDSGAGYVVTNTHILAGCNGVKVIALDGREMEASLVGADEGSDIAVLQVEGDDLPAAAFGRSDALHVGDAVAAIGNPLGQDYTGTMTNGIISAIDRNVTYEGHTMTLLQTNAALNEGNSGGPLINAEGQVVGITNMKIMSSYYTTVEGIGFAIPSSVVKQIADQLIENGLVPGNPTIGIVAGPVSAEAMRLFDLPEGIYVTEVSEGSDALEKGLQVGDVITAVNGRTVTEVAEVNEIKEGLQVGDPIVVSVYRDGEEFDLEIELVDKADIK